MSDLQDVLSDLFKIETFMRDRTTQNSKDSQDAEKLIQLLFAGTGHSAIFKQMGFGNMTHFKQLTGYAIPFLVITYLRQLQEYFFLVKGKDFFMEGMYAAIPSRGKASTRTNNIWMSKSKDKNMNRDVRVTSLEFFQPKQRVKDDCATLREWAAFIFKCEFEPKSLDASSKEIINRKSLRRSNTKCWKMT
jgi:hypothetical protein